MSKADIGQASKPSSNVAFEEREGARDFETRGEVRQGSERHSIYSITVRSGLAESSERMATGT